MSFKIAGCAGHGGFGVTPGKRTPDGEYEWNFNNKVILAFEEALKQYEGVEFLRTDDRTGRTDVPLKARTDKANAWGANAYVSFHHNASKGIWGTHTGTETFTYTSPSANSIKLAKLVQAEIIKAYGLKDRGVKQADFHIVRETHCPSILIEGGYMDSTIDIKKLRDDNVLKAAGYAVAKAFAAYAGLKKKNIVNSMSTPNISSDSADGKLVRGEQGPNVKILNGWLHELEYTTKTDDLFDQYTEAALKAFQKDYGLPQDGIYTSSMGNIMEKAIQVNKALLDLDNIPVKNTKMYRLAKFIDTQDKELIRKLKADGYKLIEKPQGE